MGLIHYLFHKYKEGDIVLLKKPHSEGAFVTIKKVSWKGYVIYIPYWDYFYITDNDIIECTGNVNNPSNINWGKKAEIDEASPLKDSRIIR